MGYQYIFAQKVKASEHGIGGKTGHREDVKWGSSLLKQDWPLELLVLNIEDICF